MKKNNNRCGIGDRVSAFRLGDEREAKRLVGKLVDVKCDALGIPYSAVLVVDGKRINCKPWTLKRARKVRHAEYRFGKQVVDVHVPILGRG